MWHGPWMVCGFFGTVVGIERAVASKRRWLFLSPVLSVAGTVVLLLQVSTAFAAGLYALAGVVLTIGSIPSSQVRRALAPSTVTACGAALWTLGSMLWWRGWPVALVFPWWMGFLLLTIIGEMLDLSSVGSKPAANLMLLSLLAVLFAGLMTLLLSAVPPALTPTELPGSTVWRETALGLRVFGTGLIFASAWLFWQGDFISEFRSSGWPKFGAVSSVVGSAWLAFSGIFFLSIGGVSSGVLYDAGLHAFFIGFVFSIVFAHAPVVLPKLLPIRLPFRAWFFVPLMVLHASLTVRLAGDVTHHHAIRQYGGLFNAAAIVLFLLGALWTAASSHVRAGAESSR